MSLLEDSRAVGAGVPAHEPLPTTVVLGGGCAGLALAVAVADRHPDAALTALEARRGDADTRTWCYWDVGAALLPEAVTASWSRWEIRTPAGSVVAEDRDHPYRMVRARDYRAAARRRIAGSRHVDLQEGVRAELPLPTGADGIDRFVDARGIGAPEPLRSGRVRLQQRFLGQWIRTARPVFDPSTVTLMDFRPADANGTPFVYVLPVTTTSALVEATVFTSGGQGSRPFREQIRAYVRERWGLADDEWAVDEEEAGSIPMTDQPADASHVAFGMRAGIARASTGYAFTRIQLAARSAAAAIAAGAALPATRDPWRVRALDAVFLRFLRDQPQRAPEVFLRMFAALPGPLTVRFLTERSSPLDELRLILALPKLPFLRAAATTAIERLVALVPRG